MSVASLLLINPSTPVIYGLQSTWWIRFLFFHLYPGPCRVIKTQKNSLTVLDKTFQFLKLHFIKPKSLSACLGSNYQTLIYDRRWSSRKAKARSSKIDWRHTFWFVCADSSKKETKSLRRHMAEGKLIMKMGFFHFNSPSSVESEFHLICPPSSTDSTHWKMSKNCRKKNASERKIAKQEESLSRKMSEANFSGVWCLLAAFLSEWMSSRGLGWLESIHNIPPPLSLPVILQLTSIMLDITSQFPHIFPFSPHCQGNIQCEP